MGGVGGLLGQYSILEERLVSLLCVCQSQENDLYMSAGRKVGLTFHLQLNTSLAIGLVNQPLPSLNKSKENRQKVTELKKELEVDLLAYPPFGMGRNSELPMDQVDPLEGSWA